MIGTAHDITSRKESELQMQQTVSRMQATLESTADGILVVDLNGRISTSTISSFRHGVCPSELVKEGATKTLLRSLISMTACAGSAAVEDPEMFIQRVTEIYSVPDVATFDVIEFRDGRVVERYSHPQRINDQPVGRV